MAKPEDVVREILNRKVEECNEQIKRYNESHPDGEPHGGCNMAWDNIMCWNASLPGTVIRRPCPNYLCGFDPNEFAERICTNNGEWWVNPDINTTWTNYTACTSPNRTCQFNGDLSSHTANADNIRLLYTIGYSISLFSLVIAVGILYHWKRLHCKSNYLHINLFLAFMLRAGMAFLKDRLFVHNLGLSKDVRELEDGTYQFIEEGYHWECRTLLVFFMFAISASQTWILMEGLYLYLLIHKTILTERLGVKPYIVFGWTLPWVFLVPWIIVKATHENTFCWNFQENPDYFWILKGPWTSIVVINFLFFMDIIRVLFMRVRNNQRHSSRSQYRKFAKFILVLIPLFGIMYIIIFMAFPKKFHGTEYDVFYLYIEMAYNSFQGFILASLFCFFNEDVHSEIRRSWNNRRSRRLNHNTLRRSMANRSSWRGHSMTTSTHYSPQAKNTKLSFRSHPRAKNALSLSPASHEDTTPLNGQIVPTPVTRNSYCATINGRNSVVIEQEKLANTADV